MKCELVFLVTFACVLMVTEAAPNKICEPGTVFKKDCNECKCNTEGTDMACTRKMCSGSQDGADPKKEQEDDSDICVPEEVFEKLCNRCICPPSGRKSEATCTLAYCYDATA